MLRSPASSALLLLGLLAAPPAAQDLPSQLRFLADVHGQGPAGAAFSGAVLVTDEGEVVLRQAYGLADLDWGIANTPDTRFRLGSITKSFTAVLVLELAERGELELGAPIARYLPEYRADTGARVTVHQLLNHTSGIPSYTDDEEFFGEHAHRRWEVSEFVERFCSGDLLFEPGSEFAYNNSGYFLLGAIVEAVTGESYDAALQRLVLDPLGLEQTGYDWNERRVERRARGYRATGKHTLVQADFLDMSIPYAAGSLYSTIDDQLRWHEALLDDRLLSEASRELMYTPGLDNYGYGWGIQDQDHPQGPRIAHSGGIHGFSTNLIRRPGAGHVVVVLSNHQGLGTSLLSNALFRLLEGEPYSFPVHDGEDFGARSSVKRQATGFGFTEGPVSLSEEVSWFSDLRARRVYERRGEEVRVLIEDSEGINGMALLPDGRVGACRGERGDVIAIHPESLEIEVLAATFEGAPFNKPNDLVVAPDGGLYFSDPAFPGGPAGQSVEAVYHLSASGELRRTSAQFDDERRPNGLELSPDARTLYLACSGRGGAWEGSPPPLLAFPVLQDGALGAARELGRVVGDGLAVNAEGTLYVSAPDERAVVAFDPVQGGEVGRLRLPESPSNCTFGGRRARMLEITARGSVYTARMRVPGAE